MCRLGYDERRLHLHEGPAQTRKTRVRPIDNIGSVLRVIDYSDPVIAIWRAAHALGCERLQLDRSRRQLQ